MKVYLNALGLVTPLGRDKDEVAGNLFKGSRAGLIERTDFLPERTIHIGTVPWTLPERNCLPIWSISIAATTG